MSYQTAIIRMQFKKTDKKTVPELQSILKNDNSRKKIRIDMNGNQINSELKQHSIHFKEQLSQIYIVENWKKYNILNEIHIGIEEERRNRCFSKCFQF